MVKLGTGRGPEVADVVVPVAISGVTPMLLPRPTPRQHKALNYRPAEQLQRSFFSSILSLVDCCAYHRYVGRPVGICTLHPPMLAQCPAGRSTAMRGPTALVGVLPRVRGGLLKPA